MYSNCYYRVLLLILIYTCSATGDTITVNDITDLPTLNQYGCSGGSSEKCNLRAAWSRCSILTTPTDCIIKLPERSTLIFNTSIGSLTLIKESSISIFGNITRISSLLYPASTNRLIYFNDTSTFSSFNSGMSAPLTSLRIMGVEIFGFGSPATDGGTIFLRGDCLLELNATSFLNSTAHWGGALYVR